MDPKIQVELGSVIVAACSVATVMGTCIGLYIAILLKQTRVEVKVDNLTKDVDAAWNFLRGNFKQKEI